MNIDTAKLGVMVVTSPRSGTHLTIDLLRRNFPALASKKYFLAPLDTVYVPIDTLFLEAEKTPARRRAIATLRRLKYPILKSHWLSPDFRQLIDVEPMVVRWLQEQVKIIYVSRSPEQTLASMYLFEQEFSKPLDAVQRDDWLVFKAKLWNHHALTWLAKKGVLHLQFDEIINSTVRTIGEISDHLGIECSLANPVLPPRIESRMQNRLLRLSINPESTEIVSTQQGKSINELFSIAAISKMKEIAQPACELIQRRSE